MKILFVCLGNICRSPIAHGILQNMSDKYNLDWIIDSAAVASYHIGKAPHKQSQKICQEHGIDISSQKARQFLEEDFSEYDHIFVMDESILASVKSMAKNDLSLSKVHLISDLDPNCEVKEIPDPYYGGPEDYVFVYNLLHNLCEKIISKYSSKIIIKA